MCTFSSKIREWRETLKREDKEKEYLKREKKNSEEREKNQKKMGSWTMGERIGEEKIDR